MSAWLGSWCRYGRGGAVETQWPRLPRFAPSLRLTRNGRMLGLEASAGDLWLSAAIYRPPWERFE